MHTNNNVARYAQQPFHTSLMPPAGAGVNNNVVVVVLLGIMRKFDLYFALCMECTVNREQSKVSLVRGGRDHRVAMGCYVVGPAGNIADAFALRGLQK